MLLGSFYKLVGTICLILFLKVAQSLPVDETELQLNEKNIVPDTQIPTIFGHVEGLQSAPQISRQVIKNEPNIILNEMFDNITEHFIPYSQYLRSAPTTEMMLLRLRIIKDYTDAKEYTGAVAKFDKFVQDFRPQSKDFDKYAFSTIDFLMFPGLSTKDYTPIELKRIRANVVKTIPTYLTEAEKTEFMRIIDTIFAL